MYVNYTYYSEEFKGEHEEDDIMPFIKAACYDVDFICLGRIKTRGFDNLTEHQKEHIRRAVCVQAEYLQDYGEYLSAPYTSYSIGDVSISLDSISREFNGVSTTSKVINLLSLTGLVSRRL